jgi:hypothetical protein
MGGLQARLTRGGRKPINHAAKTIFFFRNFWRYFDLRDPHNGLRDLQRTTATNSVFSQKKHQIKGCRIRCFPLYFLESHEAGKTPSTSVVFQGK